jgi:hypothetical protein
MPAMDDLVNKSIARRADPLEAAATDLAQLEQRPTDAALIDSISRRFHTLRSENGFLNPARIGRLAHGAERLMGPRRPGARAGEDTDDPLAGVLAQLGAYFGQTILSDGASALILAPSAPQPFKPERDRHGRRWLRPKRRASPPRQRRRAAPAIFRSIEGERL